MDRFHETTSASADIALTDEETLLQSQFMCDAVARGLFNPTIDSQTAYTIFVPLNDWYVPPVNFDEMWNRHRIKGHKPVGKETVNLQLATLANIVYALFHDGVTPASGNGHRSGYVVGGASIEAFWNLRFGGCIFHGISAPTLPDIRPSRGMTGTLKTCYLSGEEIYLRFETSHIGTEARNQLTLVTSITRDDRTNIVAPQRTAWIGQGTECRIVIPTVPRELPRVMLWFGLIDNDLKFPLVTTTLPWFIDIVPNVEMQPNLTITAIVPRTGAVDEEMWIRGHTFEPTTVRVMVGDCVAQVLYSDATLIRCVIPPGTGKNMVWVANGNVIDCFDGFQYRATA